MPFGLTISPSPRLIQEYQRILVSEWDAPQLERALELARRTLLEAGLVIHFRWEQRIKRPIRGSLASTAHYIVPPGASEDLAEYISNLNKQRVRDMREPRSAPEAAPSAELRLIEEAVFHLSLPSNRMFRHSQISIIDQTGFYRDVRSLLFRLCVEHLIPALYSESANYLHFLAGTLDEFARTEWDDQPQHRDALLADLYEQLGRTDEAAVLRERALEATSPDAHDYLTKAQALIHSLLETGDVDSAEALAFRVIRQTSEKHDSELRSILQDIYLTREVSLAHRRATSR
jgi:tetratricopeptide (TPR) repeat protein